MKCFYSMENQLPTNFKWKQYLFHNYDLVSAGIHTQKEAEQHYLEYGKDENRDYRSTPLCSPAIDELINIDIEPTKFKNSLEAVVLLMTGNELSNGLYMRFCEELEKHTYSVDLDFVVVTKQNMQNSIDIKFFKQFFNSVTIICLDIPKEYDIYYDKNSDKEYATIPDYGYYSGPNYTFYKSFDWLQKYNTCLFLECDCYFGKDWLNRLRGFVKYNGSFWMCGSIYDGTEHKPKDSGSKRLTVGNTHINGGTALYATGNQQFIKFLKLTENYLKSYVQEVNAKIAYDYFIKESLDCLFTLFIDSKSIATAKFINRQYLVNNLILNYSDEDSQKINKDEIESFYDYAILHKK